MTRHPAASVIIPTYNGAAKIATLLEALFNQTENNTEIIVVVDGSTDDTVEVIKPFKKISDQLRIIVQKNAGRARSRNRGVEEAQGDLLIFYDDDMQPAPDSIARHIAFHREHRGAILIGNAEQAVLNAASDFQHYRSYINDSWMKPYGTALKKLERQALFMTAANCSMPRQTFRELNGFDETLSDAEDKEFGLRAFKKNISLYVDMQNVALHRENLTCRAYIMRLRQYAKANDTVDRMHPDFARKTQGNISGKKKMVYRLLASRRWVNIIDGYNIFRIIPTKIRYRLYDAITYALSNVYPQTKI